MADTTQLDAPRVRSAPDTLDRRPPDRRSDERHDPAVIRWGAWAGLAGAVSMVGAFVTVIALGLPEASDVETLTDFADIERGRIVEHFFYLGAVMLFALHVLVVHRMVAASRRPAALFGAAIAEFGYVAMAASALLHVATTPMAELYTAPDAGADDRRAIEYAWYGAQSVFDTMLLTGLLLVPIGIVLLGVAMRDDDAFGPLLGTITIAFGALGALGAATEIVDRSVELAALGILAMVVFHVGAGWRMLRLRT